MSGMLVLAGGAEFGGAMREVDLVALHHAGGNAAPIRIIPTAAAPDNNHVRAGNNGVRWFQQLGAHDVASVGLIDTRSANDPAITQTLRQARLIYMLGGFTHYLGQTLADSASLAAIQAAYVAGAVVAGSSAGAMVLCDTYFDPSTSTLQGGLGFVANACVLPHHNTFGKGWARKLGALLPNATLIGIDERTALISSDAAQTWQCVGAGVITLYRHGSATIHEPGTPFQLNQ